MQKKFVYYNHKKNTGLLSLYVKNARKYFCIITPMKRNNGKAKPS
jgi:hypothetical protein